jgi:hypothetical protein
MEDKTIKNIENENDNDNINKIICENNAWVFKILEWFIYSKTMKIE